MREKLALGIAAAAGDFDGAALDFEGLGGDDSTKSKDASNLIAFVESLKRYSDGRPIYMVLPPLNGHFQGYDHKRLGELTAGIILMAYGYEDRAVPSPTAPWDKVDEAIRLELAVVPKTKLVLGVPGYGTLHSGIQDGPTLLYGPTLLSLPAARDRVFSAGVKSGYSPEAASESARWQDDKNETFEAFLESNRSLQARVSLAKRYGLRGVAIWHLGLLNQSWWDAVLQTVEPKR